MPEIELVDIMVYNQKIGKVGEEAICGYIKNRGMRVVCQNFHCRFGEIDIIAQQGKTMVFIEVKTRKNTKYGSAAEAVTISKMRKIRETAQQYLMENNLFESGVRFDVAEVYLKENKKEINYIENAF